MGDAMGVKQWGAVLATALMFGSSFLFIHIAVAEVTPVTMAAARALAALPVAAVALRLAGLRLPAIATGLRPFAVLGVLTAAVPYAAIAWGQQHIESGLAGILFGTIPLFSVVLAPMVVRGERFTTGRLVGASIGLGGVILVLGPHALAGIGDQLVGAGVTLAAALSYVLGALYARTRTELHPIVLTVGQLTVGSAILAAAAFAFEDPLALTPGLDALGAVVATGVVSTALPTILLFWLVRNAGPVRASLAPFFMPIVAVALGAALLGERLPLAAFGGLALILLGAGTVDGRIDMARLRAIARTPGRT